MESGQAVSPPASAQQRPTKTVRRRDRDGRGRRSPLAERHRQKRGDVHGRSRTGTHSPDSAGLASSGSGSDPEHVQPAHKQRRTQGAKGKAALSAGTLKGAGGAPRDSTSPVSPVDVASGHLGHQGRVQASSGTSAESNPLPSWTSRDVHPTTPGRASPLSSASSRTSVEEHEVQQQRLRSNLWADENTKTAVVTSKLKLRLKIISCAFAAAVIVALALWAIVTAASPSPRASSHVCKTHACLAYSVKLLSSINESLNP
ncbi:uncharacterized protein LOC144127537 [Amblyomma americanum]